MNTNTLTKTNSSLFVRFGVRARRFAAHIVGMTTFNEKDHPRNGDGTFARKTHSAPAAALALAGVMALAACTPGGVTPAPTDGATEPVTPPTPTAEEIAVVVAEVDDLEPGATLTEAQRRAIDKGEVPGAKAYELPNGDHVLVEREKPLPKNVQTVENKKAAESAPRDANGNITTGGTIAEIQAIARSAEFRTGKKMLVIYELFGIGGWEKNPGDVGYTIYGITGSSAGPELMVATKEQVTLAGAIKRAEAWIAKQSNPAEWGISHP
jgi:hypothetical protein